MAVVSLQLAEKIGLSAEVLGLPSLLIFTS